MVIYTARTRGNGLCYSLEPHDGIFFPWPHFIIGGGRVGDEALAIAWLLFCVEEESL